MIILLGPHIFHLLACGGVFQPHLKLLCIADLHFEKGSSFAPYGSLLPPYDSRENLEKLSAAIVTFKPHIVIAAGDSFHDKKAEERMARLDLTALQRLVALTTRWIWITGNHDPTLSALLGGEIHPEILIEGISFRHQTNGGEAPEISGHFHPKTALRTHGQTLRGPCFVQSGERLILPAFGRFTGGLDVDHPALLTVAPRENRRLYLIEDDEVYALKAEVRHELRARK